MGTLLLPQQSTCINAQQQFDIHKSHTESGKIAFSSYFSGRSSFKIIFEE